MEAMLDIEEEGTQALLAAVIQRAVQDFISGYTARRYKEAGAFLQEIGLLSADKQWTAQGQVVLTRYYRRRVTRQYKSNQAPSQNQSRS